MFDIGLSEIVVIAVVALVVIGPKELPRTLRSVGRVVGKARELAGEFHGHFNELMREADIDEARRKVDALRRSNLDSFVDTTVDPDGSLKRGLELPEDATAQPDSTAPDSTAPDSTAPDSTAPDSTAPDSTAPDSTAPDSTAPDSTAPDSTAPDSTAPDSTAPDSTAPDSAAKATEAPAGATVPDKNPVGDGENKS